MKIQILLAAFLCTAMTVELVAVTPAQRRALDAKKMAEENKGGGESYSGGGGNGGGETRRPMPAPRGGAKPALAPLCLPEDVRAAIDANPAGAARAAGRALATLGIDLTNVTPDDTVADYLGNRIPGG